MASSSSRTLPQFFKPIKKRTSTQDIYLPTDFPADLLDKIKGMVINSPDYPKPCEKTWHKVWDLLQTCEIYTLYEEVTYRLFKSHPNPDQIHQ